MLAIFLVMALLTAFAAAAIQSISPENLTPDAEAAADPIDAYRHGSDIGRAGQEGGDPVSDTTSFYAAIDNNQSMHLTSDFTIDLNQPRRTNTYSGTIYGNGHTVTIKLPNTNGVNDQKSQFAGLFAGKLSGHIYDLNVLLTGGMYETGQNTSDNGSTYFGLVGSLVAGSSIENVSITMAEGAGLTVYCWSPGSYSSLGLVAGTVEGAASVKNVTIINNGTLKAGYTTSTSDVVLSYNSDSFQHAANLIGYYSGVTTTLENIIIKGSGALYGAKASNLARGIRAYPVFPRVCKSRPRMCGL